LAITGQVLREGRERRGIVWVKGKLVGVDGLVYTLCLIIKVRVRGIFVGCWEGKVGILLPVEREGGGTRPGPEGAAPKIGGKKQLANLAKRGGGKGGRPMIKDSGKKGRLNFREEEKIPFEVENSPFSFKKLYLKILLRRKKEKEKKSVLRY